MPEERLDEYLAALDAAADWTPEGICDDHGNAAGYDEYNAWLIAVGRPALSPRSSPSSSR